MNVKRGLNLVEKPWTQFDYNITYEINCKIIDVNIHWNCLFFAVYYINNWRPRCVADHNNDFDLIST